MKTCAVPNCERPSKTRGMCGGHAERVRAGLPLEPPIGSMNRGRRPKTFEDLYVISEAGCWEWRGGLTSHGYARFKGDYGHRYAVEIVAGRPIPEGMHVDHLCRNRACVNPARLEVVTPRVNMLRGVAPTAIAVQNNRCHRGHLLTEDNVYRRPKRPNKRECRACMQLRARSAA